MSSKETFYYTVFVCILLIGVHAQTITVVDSFPSPSGIPFGLEWINGYLWHSDRAAHLIYKIDPTTHAVIRSFNPHVFDPAGLAWNGSQLFCADWSGGKIFVIDTTNGAAIDSFPSPDGSPFGLSWDGSCLMCAEANTIYKLNPVNGAVISGITIAGNFLADLAWRSPDVWVAMDNNRIVQCDTATGQIIANFPAPGPSTRGLAWDGQYLWACDNQNDRIYKISITFPISDIAVVDSFPSPSEVPFGLEWINGYLWHSDRASHLIYKIDPTTHAVIRSFSPNVFDPAGLAWDGSQLFCADWSGGKIFNIDTLSGAALDSFPSPDGSPFGLAWDGNNLWCTEAFSGRICQLNSNGSVLQCFQYPLWLNGITFDGQQFWVSGGETVVNGEWKLLRISLSGEIISSYQLPGPNPHDLAWDGKYLWLCDTYTDQIYKISIAVIEAVEHKSEIPVEFLLAQNYPNPFNPSTTIKFQIPNSNFVTLEIYNLLGQKVVTLVNENLNAGMHMAEWNATGFASGLYLYRLQAGNYSETKKLILLR